MGRKKINSDKKNIGLDDLCELVNYKYGLKPNDIGSVEYYSSMTENSIVQICNKARGVKELISGSNNILKQYLQNILDDKIILNFWQFN